MSVVIFTEMIGKVFNCVTGEHDELVFRGERSFKFYHNQDCCESVTIEDICGDLSDLENSPILVAEQVSSIDGFSAGPADYCEESFTWTFYKFATIKGSVTVRFYGTSNGYYSERVTFYDLDKNETVWYPDC